MSARTMKGGEREHLLLTGATGFLGKVVLEAVLRERPEMQISLIMRPKGPRRAEARFRRLAASPCFAGLPPDWVKRVHVAEGDLSQPGAGLGADSHNELVRNVTHVVHCAASIDFDLPLPDALRANVDSALNVMELARACADLRSVVSVSTAYVTPHRADAPILEEPPPLYGDPSELYDRVRRQQPDERRLLEETRRPNTYTLTKSLCEHLLIQRYNDLPLSILRPSIISACRRSPSPGWIDSSAAFAAFVYLVGAGHLQELIGNPKARVDIVPCDVVSAHILELLFDPPAAGGGPRIRHSTAGVRQAATIRDAAEEIITFFRQYQVDRWPRIRYLGPSQFVLSLYRLLGNTVGLLALRGALFRRRGREKRRQADEMNARFRYFMLNTFDFHSSLPWPDPPLEPRGYVRTVCRGVYRHMMRRSESELLVAGRRHCRAQHDWHWMITQRIGRLSTRLSLYRIRTRLGGWAHRVTIDEPALTEARLGAAPGSVLLLHPTVSHSVSTAALLTAYAILTRPSLGFGAIWVLSEAHLPPAVRALLPSGATMPRAHRRPWVLAARDSTSALPAGTVYADASELQRLITEGTPLAQIPVELNTDPDEHTLSQQEDASSLLMGSPNGSGGTQLLRQIARSLPAHHGHVRSAHLQFELARGVPTGG